MEEQNRQLKLKLEQIQINHESNLRMAIEATNDRTNKLIEENNDNLSEAIAKMFKENNSNLISQLNNQVQTVQNDLELQLQTNQEKLFEELKQHQLTNEKLAQLTELKWKDFEKELDKTMLTQDALNQQHQAMKESQELLENELKRIEESKEKFTKQTQEDIRESRELIAKEMTNNANQWRKYSENLMVKISSLTQNQNAKEIQSLVTTMSHLAMEISAAKVSNNDLNQHLTKTSELKDKRSIKHALKEIEDIKNTINTLLTNEQHQSGLNSIIFQSITRYGREAYKLYQPNFVTNN